LTPSDEKELSDVKDLLSVGSHVIKVTKAGMEGSKTVNIVDGDNGTINIKLETIGLPPAEEEIPEEEKPPTEGVIPVSFKIYFTSDPSGAKLYVDDVYTHHLTPSDEKELSDVMNLLTVGTHKIKVTKAGMIGEKTITVLSGDNGTHHIKLETVGLPPVTPPTPTTLEQRVTKIEEDIALIKQKLGV